MENLSDDELKRKVRKETREIILIGMSMFICGLLSGWLIFTSVTNDVPSPYPRIHRSNIEVYSNKVVIKVNNPILVGYTDTNSMDPELDVGMKGIMVKPSSPTDINEGDIISYEYNISSNKTYRITHRVVEIGSDNSGWYVIAKGDNNKLRDPFKIRWDDIQGVQIGVIY